MRKFGAFLFRQTGLSDPAAAGVRRFQLLLVVSSVVVFAIVSPLLRYVDECESINAYAQDHFRARVASELGFFEILASAHFTLGEYLVGILGALLCSVLVACGIYKIYVDRDLGWKRLGYASIGLAAAVFLLPPMREFLVLLHWRYVVLSISAAFFGASAGAAVFLVVRWVAAGFSAKAVG